MDRINEWLEWLAQTLSAGLRWEYRVTRNDSIGFELVDATLSCADSDMPVVHAWGVANDGRIRVEFDLSLNMPERMSVVEAEPVFRECLDVIHRVQDFNNILYDPERFED